MSETAGNMGDGRGPGGTEENLERLVESHMPLVRHVVNRVVAGSTQSCVLQYEDMVSCGTQGLLEAQRTYDETRGAKFSTYALPRIRGAILDALRAVHPLSRSMQKASADIERANGSLTADLGRTPTREETATRLDISLDEFHKLRQGTSVRVISLEGATSAWDGDTGRMPDVADNDPGIDPHEIVQSLALRSELLQAVEGLPEREREIVRLYYLESRSLKSIGQSMDISESRASQLRHRAIRRLQRVMLVDDLPAAA